ncbi:MAG: hypothetical protein H6873_05640 [Hyphomicrobiaceae bacterium]|nr:hypothetical protein [Hyphomicrobiaceae bacterium]
MTTYHGKNGVIKSGANAIAEVKGFQVTETSDVADDTVQGDTWKTHLGGQKSWSGSLNGLYYPGDTNGQATLVAGASISLELDTIGNTSGLEKITGTATITSISIDSNDGGAVTFTAQFQGNGAMTRGSIA